VPNPKIATLTDAFPGSSLNASNWYVEPDSSNGNPSGTVTVSGGVLSLAGGAYSDTGYYTSVNSQHTYDLTSSAAFCKVVPNTGSSDYDTGFAVMAANFSDGYGIGVTGGNCYVQSFVSDNPTTLHTVAYNATSMAWMRVSESGGTITFATSPDSATWTTRYTTTTESVGTWTAASSNVQLYYGSTSGSAKPSGTTGFRDFNVAGGSALTATASLAVTPSRTAATSGGSPARFASASLAVAPSLAATPALTGLVQETSGHTTGTSLTLTFANPVAVGHAVIVCIAGYYDGTVTGITLGTSGGSFSHSGGAGGTGGNNAGIYANLSATQASATLVITTSAAGILAWAYEVAGNVCFDTVKGSTGTGTSWSSGTSAETVPYPHFVVGIGSVIANTGSVTSTGSGWTNESSITNVVGAGSHAIGAVSGYRQAQTSGTYTYSGTSGSSSAWGAVTAAFMVLPPGGGFQTGWAGLAFAEHASYTGVTATFSVPSSMPLNTAALCSVWVGIGNVYQTGIYLGTTSGNPGNVSASPWSWWFGGGGGAGELWDQAAFPVGAGDSLTLDLSVDGTYWYATITNSTQDWTYTEVRSVLGLNVSTWAQDGTGAPVSWGWIYPVPGAEVIVEQEASDLPDYATITFTDVATVPPVSRPPAPLFTVPSAADGITQYPSAFSIGAGSFSMNWNKVS
jgi:hypothetical protein